MSAFALTGLGSGLPIGDLVTNLVNAQKAPQQNRIIRQQGELGTNISSMGAFKSSLQDVYDSLEKLSDIDNFQQRSVRGTDSHISISADKEASVGSYDVTVDRLAKSHKLLSANTFSSDEKIGEGTLKFNVGESDFTIDVTAETTLSELKDLINDESANKGVSASIITDENGQYLVLNATKTGKDNAISITATPEDPSDPDNRLDEFDFDPADVANSPLTEQSAATDAQITIDGTITVTSSDNTFSDAIEGLTITAKKVHEKDDDDSSISVQTNNNAAKEALEGFVEAFNVLSSMNKQLTSKDGPMSGDSMLRSIMTSLRSSIGDGITLGDGSKLHLSQLGVESDQYGKLSFDGSVFDKFSKENPQALEEFFIGVGDNEDGFASSLSKYVKGYTESSGLIDSRVKGYNDQLDRLTEDSEALERKMTAYETRLLNQFNAMDAIVANLNSTSGFLQQQLANLPGVVKESN